VAEYTYIGYGTRGYAAYVDTETEKMLVAEQGKAYDMRPTWQDLPVPPADGLWVVAMEPLETQSRRKTTKATSADDTAKAGE
jgi:hypothetical protein